MFKKENVLPQSAGGDHEERWRQLEMVKQVQHKDKMINTIIQCNDAIQWYNTMIQYNDTMIQYNESCQLMSNQILLRTVWVKLSMNHIGVSLHKEKSLLQIPYTLNMREDS